MNRIFIISLVFFIFLGFAFPALAQRPLEGSGCLADVGSSTDIVTISCIPILFSRIIYWLFVLSGVVALFFIIYSGIKLITSSGDPKRVEEAKKTLLWAIIGLVVIFLSFMIVNLVADFTGVNCITEFGFTNCGP